MDREPPQDRNFDDLAQRFKRNVYDQLKGDIRLAVLRRDLAEQVPALQPLGSAGASRTTQPLRILDAGGGQGQLAIELAHLGHHLDLCDISAEMLALARDQATQAGVQGIHFIHDSIQAVAGAHPHTYDLILCHAVLEWVVEPQALLAALLSALKPGGYFSLTFYNVNSIKMKNLLRANFRKVLAEQFQGQRGSLTPTYPRETGQVMGWLEHSGLELLCHSGIRCFHDYILDNDRRALHPEQQLELELQLSRQEPFRSLGRYVHLLMRRG